MKSRASIDGDIGPQSAQNDGPPSGTRLVAPASVFPMLIVPLVGGIVAAAVYRATTAEERREFFEHHIVPAAAKIDEVIWATEPFRALLRARTPRLIVTPVIVGLNILVFGAMLSGEGSFVEPGTLLDWGANHGPRTTHGEWWRLGTALFVHTGFFHLLFMIIGLVQVGELLERLVGPAVVACVYVSAGTVAGLVSLDAHPLAIHVGASAATFGLYGLLLAVAAWGRLRRGALMVPLAVFQTLAPAAVVFLLYNLFTDVSASTPSLIGMAVGLGIGLAAAMDVSERKPARRPLALAMGVVVGLTGYLALPLRGLIDIRPALAELVASEDRTANTYRIAVARYAKKQKAIDTHALSDLIDRTIVPQLSVTRAHLDAIGRVLPDHQPLVASAREYLRLREESWRLRAEGLRKGDISVLREAEKTERASIEALRQLRAVRTRIEVHT